MESENAPAVTAARPVTTAAAVAILACVYALRAASGDPGALLLLTTDAVVPILLVAWVTGIVTWWLASRNVGWSG